MIIFSNIVSISNRGNASKCKPASAARPRRKKQKTEVELEIHFDADDDVVLDEVEIKEENFSRDFTKQKAFIHSGSCHYEQKLW